LIPLGLTFNRKIIGFFVYLILEKRCPASTGLPGFPSGISGMLQDFSGKQKSHTFLRGS